MGSTARIEDAQIVDRISRALNGPARRILGKSRLRDMLSGRQVGHPAHPALVIMPMGFWASALLSDLLGERRAAQKLTAAGVLAVLPAAATGLSDWIDTEGAEQRVGTVHLLANTTATALFAAAWVARATGRNRQASALRGCGAVALGAGGWLGGHLAYALGVGVDTNAFEWGPTEWTAVVEGARRAHQAVWSGEVAGVGVVLVDGDNHQTTADSPQPSRPPRVLANRCSHRGGPLAEGRLRDGCIECPWHQSEFNLETGAVVRGPAVVAQPVYEVRRAGSGLEVRRDEKRALRLNSTRA